MMNRNSGTKCMKVLAFIGAIVNLTLHLAQSAEPEHQARRPPNVVFIAVDDLNHWVGHLGRNPQTQTPNIDRLASMGLTLLEPIVQRLYAIPRELHCSRNAALFIGSVHE